MTVCIPVGCAAYVNPELSIIEDTCSIMKKNKKIDPRMNKQCQRCNSHTLNPYNWCAISAPNVHNALIKQFSSVQV